MNVYKMKQQFAQVCQCQTGGIVRLMRIIVLILFTYSFPFISVSAYLLATVDVYAFRLARHV